MDIDNGMDPPLLKIENEEESFVLVVEQEDDQDFDKDQEDSQEDDEDEDESEEEEDSIEIPTESVLAMAESVGVSNLSEEIAEFIGSLAMDKLRAITLLACQFRDHENNDGLLTSDFEKAEEILNTPSYGNRSDLPLTPIIPVPAGNFSFYDEGAEINLTKDILANESEDCTSTEIILKVKDPKLHVKEYPNELLCKILKHEWPSEESENWKKDFEDRDEDAKSNNEATDDNIDSEINESVPENNSI